MATIAAVDVASISAAAATYLCARWYRGAAAGGARRPGARCTLRQAAAEEKDACSRYVDGQAVASCWECEAATARVQDVRTARMRLTLRGEPLVQSQPQPNGAVAQVEGCEVDWRASAGRGGCRGGCRGRWWRHSSGAAKHAECSRGAARGSAAQVPVSVISPTALAALAVVRILAEQQACRLVLAHDVPLERSQQRLRRLQRHMGRASLDAQARCSCLDRAAAAATPRERVKGERLVGGLTHAEQPAAIRAPPRECDRRGGFDVGKPGQQHPVGRRDRGQRGSQPRAAATPATVVVPVGG
jgi:hypothetical protein